jgi:hypothetical protein
MSGVDMSVSVKTTVEQWEVWCKENNVRYEKTETEFKIFVDDPEKKCDLLKQAK